MQEVLKQIKASNKNYYQIGSYNYIKILDKPIYLN